MHAVPARERLAAIVAAALVAGPLGACGTHRPSASPVTTTATFAALPPASSPTTSAAPPTTTEVVAPVPVTSLPAIPSTPSDLAAALLAVETRIHDPATDGRSIPDLGAAEQRLVATLASHPTWTAAVVAALPAERRADVTGSVEGDRELSSVPGPTPTEIPPWTIVAPRPAAELLADYQAASAATGVPWGVLAAINLVETRMGRIVGPSSAGAQGPMQFLPATWARYGAGGDIHDPRDAVFAAARLLRANGGLRDIAAALYHYNPSTSYGRGVLAFAAVMAADPAAFDALYGWRVYVTTTAGTFWLPEGYQHP